MQQQQQHGTRQHAPLRRVLPKQLAEMAPSTSVAAQHCADHPLLFATDSLQSDHGISSCPPIRSPVVVQQRVSLPIQQQKVPSPTTTTTGGGTASASSLVDSCYSSCSDGEQQQHLVLSRETSDCSSCGGQAEELRQRLTLSAENGCDTADAMVADPTTTSLQNSSPVDAQLLEFATRLGYTENDLRTVLQHLGSAGGKEQHQQDLVLGELIKLDRQQRRQSLPSPCAAANGAPRRTTPVAQQRQKAEQQRTADQPQHQQSKKLRPIVLDGSNIAMTHGNKTVFSCVGIRECVQFFANRGHSDILVFVPHFRREQPRADSPIVDQHILLELEAQRRLVWTPSRRVGGRRIVCHDDRYILKTAADKQAVIVSNDEYRDLVRENPLWRAVVDNLLLMYSFVDGKFMPPDDPLGRRGPKLEQFLTFAHTPLNAQLCPYAKKCTYGNKCKYFHPERVNGVWISATDRLTAKIANDAGSNAKQLLAARPSMIAEHSQRQNAASSLLPSTTTALHNNVGRTRSLNCGAEQAAEAQPSLISVKPKVEQQQQQQQHNLLLAPFNHRAPAHLPLLRFESSPAGIVPAAAVALSALPVRPPVVGTTTAQHQQQNHSHSHCPLSRILSAPAAHQQQQQQCQPKQHMYSPSSAVWGNCEFSLSGGGVAQSTALSCSAAPSPTVSAGGYTAGQQQRQRVQYHLCQLFPEATVLAVMGAHPTETDAQRLCQRIIAFQRGFADNNNNNNSNDRLEVENDATKLHQTTTRQL